MKDKNQKKTLKYKSAKISGKIKIKNIVQTCEKSLLKLFLWTKSSQLYRMMRVDRLLT